MIINSMSQTASLDMIVKVQAQVSEKVREAEPQKVVKKSEEKSSTPAAPQSFDTFEKDGENSTSKVAGIYRMGMDENGNQKIMFDKPKNIDKNEGKPSKLGDASKSEEDKKAIASESTVNTDKVDAEIKKLQKERQEIQRQLQSEKDVVKREKLELRLKNLESELQAKDNDGYRKQHATYTMG